jgi:inorganic pyrophosphatase
MGANALAIDRVLPEEIGGYPVNYGFVPQTVSYDGDPFDVLVLGPPLTGGEVVAGVIVGLMYMEDEKGLDSKVVLSAVGPDGQPLHDLTDAERERIAAYFREYKRGQPGHFSKVPGWGSAAEGRAHVAITHAFFRKCRARAGAVCRIAPVKAE